MMTNCRFLKCLIFLVNSEAKQKRNASNIMVLYTHKRYCKENQSGSIWLFHISGCKKYWMRKKYWRISIQEMNLVLLNPEKP